MNKFSAFKAFGEKIKKQAQEVANHVTGLTGGVTNRVKGITGATVVAVAQLLGGGAQAQAPVPVSAPSPVATVPPLQTRVDIGGGTEVSGGIGYSRDGGATIDMGLLTGLGDDGALSIQTKLGPKFQEFLVRAGIPYGIDKKGMVVLTGDTAIEKAPHQFASGEATVKTTQQSFGAEVQHKLDNMGPATAVTGSIHYINAPTVNLSDKQFTVDTPASYWQGIDHRSLTGYKATGFDMGVVLQNDAKTITVTPRIGYEKSKYDTYVPTPSKGYLTQSVLAEYRPSLSEMASLQLSRSNGSKTRAELRYNTQLNSTVGWYAGVSNMGTGTTVTTGLNISLDGKNHTSYKANTNDQVGFTSRDVRNIVQQKPAYTALIARSVDTTRTPTTELSIDKTKLPPNTTLTAQGDIVITDPLGFGKLISAQNTTTRLDLPKEFYTVMGNNTIILHPKFLLDTLATGDNKLFFDFNDATIEITAKKGSVLVTDAVVKRKITNTPIDTLEDITQRNPVITSTSISFTGASVVDADAPSGFNYNIRHIIRDKDGKIVDANHLTPDTEYTETMQYDAYDGATNLIIKDRVTAPQIFHTLVATPPPSVDSPTTTTLSVSNITPTSATFNCNIADLDGATGTCILRDANNKEVAKWAIGSAPHTVSQLTSGAKLTLAMMGIANKRNLDGTIAPVSLNQLIDITTLSTPDTVAPVITLNGASSMTLTVGSPYSELGAACKDNKDTACTVVTTGTVNTAVVGTYPINYRSTDTAGNISVKERTVKVVAAPILTPTIPANMPTSFDVNGPSGSIDLSSYMQTGWKLEFVSVADPGVQNGVGSRTVNISGPVISISVPGGYGTYNIPMILKLTNSAGSSPDFQITAYNIGN